MADRALLVGYPRHVFNSYNQTSQVHTLTAGMLTFETSSHNTLNRNLSPHKMAASLADDIFNLILLKENI